MTAGKLARSISTQGGIHHIGFLPVPSQTTEIRHVARLTMRTTSSTQSIVARCGSTIVYISMAPIVEALFQITLTATYRCSLIATGFHTNQHTEGMVILPSKIILGRVGPRQRQAMVHTLTNRGAGVVITIWTEVIERREATILAGAIDSTKHAAQFQSLQRGEFCIHIATEVGTLILIVGIGHHATIRVAIILIPITIVGSIIRTAVEAVILTGLSTSISLTSIKDIGSIYRCQWRSAKSATQGVVILIAHTYACTLSIYIAYLLTHFQQLVDHIVLRVDTEVVALIVRNVLTTHDTFLTHVT